ncbi:MAG: hypothetical protein JWR03_913 [Cohnella sp.]|nr:hypothetical protein [Cohnella sp.]
MRFRQVHLDFHTSEYIDNIGALFSKTQFQEMLKLGKVDSITVFSKCHHGWAYHPSTANEIHPGLSFDLLGAMIEAAHEIGVKTPVYLSAGLDEKLAKRRPEWLLRDREDRTSWVKNFMEPGYHEFCMNSPYLDVLLAQVEEVVRNYDADGLFLDITGVKKCYCHRCLAQALSEEIDFLDERAMLPLWERTYAHYTTRVRETIDTVKPGLPVFHNGGHIRRGRRDLAVMNTHLELESLPTGGWGYDHFPLSARYAQPLGMDFLGMTGKFHTTWGEFGGYKHPNALRYEASLSLANGARCSIGDQLHPEGMMDPATYALIGAAYREVEAKEAWCSDTRNIADIALLSLEATGESDSEAAEARFTGNSDAGAARILLEGKFLFDVIDLVQDFHRYQVIILPDRVKIGAQLAVKLHAFVADGGKVLATGISGLKTDGSGFGLDFGVKWLGENVYRPSYCRPDFDLLSLSRAGFVMYSIGQNVELSEGGRALGYREEPYFNRQAIKFCSHQHTPSSLKAANPGITEGRHGIYIAWDIFEEYATKGSLHLKEMVIYALNRLLPDKTLETNLPAQGVVTLQAQREPGRLIQHLLYAVPVKRGEGIEVIEDILPLYEIGVTVRTERPVRKVYLAPQMMELPFEISETGVRYTVPKLECHQMVVIET